jgi:leucyl/phenylalanyl-tRNA--protein transferase
MSPNPLAGLMPVRPLTDDPMGLLAVGGEITPQALYAAVQLGLFPWTGSPPIPWCSPDPRAVIEPGAVRISRSLRKSIRNRDYRVTYDHDFDAVVRAAATTPRPGQPGTWLTPNLAAAWTELHAHGVYHSVEVWRGDDLVGGLVGMALGACFFGDTMFHRARDASKVALVTLCRDLSEAGFKLVDAQAPTPHLRSLGALELSRTVYLLHLKAALQAEATPASWRHGIPSIGKARSDSPSP